MSREYGKVLPRFWVAGTGKALRGNHLAQALSLYLITGPHGHPLGIYHLSLPALAHDLGSPLEGASQALRRVCEVGFASYDDDAEVVWVPEMARIQIGDEIRPPDKRHRWLLREVENLPKCRFLKDFYDRYEQPFALKRPKGLERVSEAPSKAHRSQEQEQEQEQEQDLTHRRVRRRAAKPSASAPVRKPSAAPDSVHAPVDATPVTAAPAHDSGYDPAAATVATPPATDPVKVAGGILITLWNKAGEIAAKAYPEGPRWPRYDSDRHLGATWARVNSILAGCGGDLSAFETEVRDGLRALLDDPRWWNNAEKNPKPSMFLALHPDRWGERVVTGRSIREDDVDEDHDDVQRARDLARKMLLQKMADPRDIMADPFNVVPSVAEELKREGLLPSDFTLNGSSHNSPEVKATA